MSESATDPLALLLVSGSDAGLRGDLIDAIRAMETAEGRDLAIVSGNAEALDDDLARVLAVDDIMLAVIELGDDDDPALVLDTVEPLVEDEAAMLIGALAAIDAGRFWHDFREGDANAARQLVAAIEAASLVALAHSQAADAESLRTLDGFVRNLNPTAAMLQMEDLARLSLPEISVVIAEAEAAGDESADSDDELLAGEVDAWGFNSFTWSTEMRLDRGRFLALFEHWPTEVLCAHGVARFADGATAVLSVVRDTVAIDEYDGDDHDDHDHAAEVELSGDEDLDLGEDESEIAFVGIGMPVADLVARLDACQIET
ncbi:MAG: GTP-binding protein [Thermomicrobiales bacterium]